MADTELISLGYNCEISFRIEDFLGNLSSYPFSWSYELDRNLFVECLKNNLQGLFEDQITYLSDRMFKCEKYQIKFHPRYDKLVVNRKITEESIAWCKQELIDRVNHLKEKFINLQKSDRDIIFFIKVIASNFGEDRAYILNVYEQIKTKFNKFKLVVVVADEELENQLKQIENENLYIRGLKKFANQKRTNISGDIKGWYKILTELYGSKSKVYYKNLRKRREKWFKEVLKAKHIM